MPSNRGVVYLKPGMVEVQKIDFPTFRDPAGKPIDHGVILKVVTTNTGNFGMQRRRVHGVMADPGYNPRAIMDHEFIPFTKQMEGIGTVPGPVR